MSLRGRSVLVAGGAGFIGSHLVDRLVYEEPERIVVLDNFFLGREEHLDRAARLRPDLQVIRVDAADLVETRRAIEGLGIDTAFNLAVVPLPMSLMEPDWTVRTNVAIATTFCELTRTGLIGQLVHVSSSEVYGSARRIPMDEEHQHDALTPYAASKSAGDQVVGSYVNTFGVHASIVRPFNNFGPRQNAGAYAAIIPIVITRVLNGEPIVIFGDGEQTRDFIFVQRTVDLIVRSADITTGSKKVINLGSGCETSMNELVRRILDIMKRPDHPMIYADARLGDVRRHCADVSLAREYLNLEAVPLSDAELAETIEWYEALPV